MWNLGLLVFASFSSSNSSASSLLLLGCEFCIVCKEDELWTDDCEGYACSLVQVHHPMGVKLVVEHCVFFR